jgi:hypothetical protein
MREKDAHTLIESYAEIADKVVEAQGEVLPVMFYSGKDGPTMLDLRDMFAGPPSQKHIRKDAGMAAVRDILKVEDADWCLMIVEAWTATMEAKKGVAIDKQIDALPSGGVEQVLGRQEVVWFQFEDQELGQMLAKRLIIRESEKPRLGPLEWMPTGKGESQGRMVGLLPPRGRAQ